MRRSTKLVAILLLVLSIIGFASCDLTPQQLAAIQSHISVRQQADGLCTSRTRSGSFREVNNCVTGWVIANQQGETWDSFVCADYVVTGESDWRNVPNAAGGRSFGIPQALPGSKMASHGADWKTNPATQIRWMYDYMRDRYGSFCKAAAAKKAKGWY